MKRAVLNLILIMTPWILEAQAYHTYKMEQVAQFQVGKTREAFKVNFRDDYPQGPTAMTFNEKGELFLSDPLNMRVLKLNDRFTYEAAYTDIFADNVAPMFYAQAGYLYYGISNRFFFDKLENGVYKKAVEIDLNKSKFGNNLNSETDFIYYKEIFFARLRDGKLIAIKKPSLDIDSNNRSIIEHDQVVELLKDKLFSDLVIDSSGFFVNGGLSTFCFDVFYRYYSAKIGAQMFSMIKVGFDFSKMPNSEMLYLGFDSEKNYYWRAGIKWLYIFNSKGILIDAVEYAAKDSKIVPALHPSGSLYFLNYNSEVISLLKISRVWK